MTREEVVDKIRKLRNHAKSAEEIGSEAEAQAFAAAMQRMMAEHKVREHELKDKEDEDIVVVPVGGPKYGLKIVRKRVRWSEDLADVVAKAHWCKIIVHHGSNIISFVGTPEDVEASSTTYAYLAQCAEILSEKEYVRAFYDEKNSGGDVRRVRGFRKSFLIGFTSRLSERYEEEMKRMRIEEVVPKGAVVLFQSALERADQFILEMKGIKMMASKRLEKTNLLGYLRGQQAADEIKMRRETEGKRIKS